MQLQIYYKRNSVNEVKRHSGYLVPLIIYCCGSLHLHHSGTISVFWSMWRNNTN